MGADEFGRGFDSVLNLHKVIVANASRFQSLFTHDPAEFCLTRRSFKALFRYMYSDEGSNKRRQESETVYAWEMLLQDIEGGQYKVF